MFDIQTLRKGCPTPKEVVTHRLGTTAPEAAFQSKDFCEAHIKKKKE